ncbi:molybdate ABC transporter substrate-binding protein [Rhodoplanes sp. Z2-YC6860]|uniref:molybdate ABC transporter substrate-binding protein n=1 Tax=Rhodoplanes sp. Z2-YC6860 TaxID=674703 RepID=UPI00078B1C85|nr:substrate-binding domain-containing protein [Rhodoplanes sp. Z2-YC6860]AMN39550.1 molybdate ABC transporter periplasmic protein [Rhodoplanes sp. Z2-YC6860]
MTKIRVMSAGAVEGPVAELAPKFTQAKGIEVDLAFNTVGALKQRFTGGEKADAIILSFPAIEALEAEGRIAPGSRTDLGLATCGVAVRDGMMMPNIATLDGFKRMLNFAVSIAANDPAHGGSSGIYLADLLKRMGLYEQIAPKMKLYKTGRECALALVRGEAEIGITFTSEFIAVPGTRVVGVLPGEIAYVNGYAGAIAKDGATEPARAFLKFLTEPESKACFARFGLG